MGRRRVTLVDVNLWGRRIGAARQRHPISPATFEYDPLFLGSSVEPSPLRMVKRPGNFEFPALPAATFRGLPGMLWDSLPDRFGVGLIERYHRSFGREPASLDALELLSYVGTRGMGALEYAPAVERERTDELLDVGRLREFAALAVEEESNWTVDLGDTEGLAELLEVGTSAGGARPKAVIGWNRETNEVRSGRIDLGAGFEYWLLKFDAITDRQREIGTSSGYGAIEYAYSRLAELCGIEMSECHLFEENGRRHFMTRRFDRTAEGGKLHMQTLAGLAHIDFNVPASGSYEDAFDALRAVNSSGYDIEQQYRRMIFNVVFRNQDDHPKNISLLMDKSGAWSLSPAYDLSFAFNPSGEFTSRHQMSINGKLDDFTRSDFETIAKHAGLVQGRWSRILDETIDHASEWLSIANDVEIDADRASAIASRFRLEFPS